MESVLCCPDIPLWLNCPPVPASAFPVLSVWTANPQLQAVRSCHRIPILFPTLPTTSGNLLTTFCKNLQIKHAAVVTNPQTQRLHFKNDWWVWVVFYFFLIKLGDFAQLWKQRRTQRSQAKGLLLWGAAPVAGVQDCGEMLNLSAQGPDSPCWEPGVCEHPWFPCSGFSLPKFILQDPHPLNAKQAL